MQLSKITQEIFLIQDFWSKEQCNDFIEKTESRGYRDAAINTDRGQRVVKSVRNNKRVMYTDHELAAEIWNDLSGFAPASIGNSTAIGLNELFRFYRYEPGEEFKRHRDQSYIRNNQEASYYTFMIYLNHDFEGGETTFGSQSIRPIRGMALIFLHSLEHAGSAVKKGTKYVLRTDIMYRLKEL
ncbi:MAG: 2OG-Fe(II) oxygenase [Chitinophagaceae bacterium]